MKRALHSRLASLLASACLLFGAGCDGIGKEPKHVPPQIDTKRRVVRVPALLHLKAFRKGSPPGHHLLTWSGGRAGKKALLATPVSDSEILAALVKLGAKPGDNLSAECWTKRTDPKHPAPDLKAKGTPLVVTLILPSGERHPISALVKDVDKKGRAWVLAGNRKLIPVWKSGCVICLQSCPGSKISNAKATMRDLHHKRARYVPSKLAEALGEGAKLQIEIGFPPPKRKSSKPAAAKSQKPKPAKSAKSKSGNPR